MIEGDLAEIRAQQEKILAGQAEQRQRDELILRRLDEALGPGVTIDEFAKITNSSRSTVYRKIERKEIPVIRPAGRPLVPRWFLRQLSDDQVAALAAGAR